MIASFILLILLLGFFIVFPVCLNEQSFTWAATTSSNVNQYLTKTLSDFFNVPLFLLGIVFAVSAILVFTAKKKNTMLIALGTNIASTFGFIFPLVKMIDYLGKPLLDYMSKYGVDVVTDLFLSTTSVIVYIYFFIIFVFTISVFIVRFVKLNKKED